MTDFNDDNLYRNPEEGSEPSQQPQSSGQDNAPSPNQNGSEQNPCSIRLRTPTASQNKMDTIKTIMAKTTIIRVIIRTPIKIPTTPFRPRDSRLKRKAILWPSLLWF